MMEDIYSLIISFVKIKISSMLTGNHLTLKRIRKEEQSLIKEPIKNVKVRREGNYKFHFVIYGLDGPYEGGYYHGMLELHHNYPFDAPKLYFYTPSGRFQINLSICTTFTHYHPESWSAIWNVRSMIQATVSFMTSNEGAYGVITSPQDKKKQYAQQSMNFNKKNPKFLQIFKDDFPGIYFQQKQKKPTKPQVPLLSPQLVIKILAGAILVAFTGYKFFKK